MSPRARSILILLATLTLGMVAGALAVGAIVHHRRGEISDLRHQAGFVRFVMESIEPRDQAQRQAILPHVEAAARANQAEMEATHARLMENVTQMRKELRLILDDAQMERLEASIAGASRHGGQAGSGRHRM